MCIMVRNIHEDTFTEKIVLIALIFTLALIMVDAWRNPDHAVLSFVAVAFVLNTTLNRRKR